MPTVHHAPTRPDATSVGSWQFWWPTGTWRVAAVVRLGIIAAVLVAGGGGLLANALARVEKLQLAYDKAKRAHAHAGSPGVSFNYRTGQGSGAPDGFNETAKKAT